MSNEGESHVGYVGQKKKKKEIRVHTSVSLYFSCSVTWSPPA